MSEKYRSSEQICGTKAMARLLGGSLSKKGEQTSSGSKGAKLAVKKGGDLTIRLKKCLINVVQSISRLVAPKRMALPEGGSLIGSRLRSILCFDAASRTKWTVGL
jgi:hypothetical protein